MAFLGLISWSLFVDGFRLISILFFVLFSLSINWYSFGSLISTLISLYVLDRNRYNPPPKPKPAPFPGTNPYKGKKRLKDEESVSVEIKEKYTKQILDLVMYDMENCEALRNFDAVKNNTHCIFSKKSILWGAFDYDKELSIELNVTRSLPALTKFLAIGSTLNLDGFLFELPGEKFHKDIDSFGQGVRRLLKCISDADPSGYHCMNKSFLSKIGWSFEYCGVPIFVTTFSACYPENHSRYSFGVESSFVLLQPMYSFAIHNISPDTPHTNWEHPVTERDNIRVDYKANNRGYLIRDTIMYPMAHDIVKPLIEGPDNVVEWWKDPNEAEEKKDEELEGMVMHFLEGDSTSESEDSEEPEVQEEKKEK